MATVLWITYACTGETVELTDEALEHIRSEHPDLAVDEDMLRMTVQRPDVCTLEVDGSLNFYAKGIVPRRTGRYLHVLVRRGGHEAQLEVRSAWASKAVDHPYEEILC